MGKLVEGGLGDEGGGAGVCIQLLTGERGGRRERVGGRRQGVWSLTGKLLRKEMKE